MAGYWKNSTSTADTVKEGWLYTGDMGYMGKDGYLYVLGRFKSLLIGSDGEKYSPEGIEEALVSMTHHIDQVVLHNNQDAYTTALIVPNKDALKRHIKHAPDSSEGRKEAVQLLMNEINKFRGAWRRACRDVSRAMVAHHVCRTVRTVYRTKPHGKQHYEGSTRQSGRGLCRNHRFPLYRRRKRLY